MATSLRKLSKFVQKRTNFVDERAQSQNVLVPSAFESSQMEYLAGWPSEGVVTTSVVPDQTVRPSQKVSKTTSLTSMSNTSDEYSSVDEDHIFSLTQDVKSFSDVLGKLKLLFTNADGSANDIRVSAHECLGEVLCILKNVLQRYPALNSAELFSTTGILITQIKSFNYEELVSGLSIHGLCDAIDQLALAFSSSVSEYLMGDVVTQSLSSLDLKSKPFDALSSVSEMLGSSMEVDDREPEVKSPEDADKVLLHLESGVDLALRRAKAWSKYVKEIMSYIERKAQLEAEYAKNLIRLAQSMMPILTEEGFLPFQSVYCTVLAQDIEYATACQATQALLQSNKFVEPLSARRQEHDKVRKSVKETWVKESKKMNEVIGNLHKARSLYITRQQEYEKAREIAHKHESESLSQSTGSVLGKMDKRKKIEEDALLKASESEITYKACVAEANYKQQDFEKVKKRLLASIREQIVLCDQTMQSVTVEYFQLLHAVSAPLPVQYHTLCEMSRQYEAGGQYTEFARRLPLSVIAAGDKEPYVFEPYTHSNRFSEGRKLSSQSTESLSSLSQDGSPVSGRQRKADQYRVPVRAWGQGSTLIGSDTDSGGSSNRSLESSPNSSPRPDGYKVVVRSASSDQLDDGGHRKGNKKEKRVDPGIVPIGRRNTTFGVDFQEQVQIYKADVPPIIIKCLKEIEMQGITTKGIYRVSGVKSKVENLCHKFEMDPESISMEEQQPSVISNVLKLYLRQLPEPLLSFRLYPRFIQTAKENLAACVNRKKTTQRLQDIAQELPTSNFKTCAFLMHHLSRVAAHSDTNQMNASNLGIVFGPTLLRPQEGAASLTSLVDTPHQTRVVELLIVLAQEVFGPEEHYRLIPTPVEEISEVSANADMKENHEQRTAEQDMKDSSENKELEVSSETNKSKDTEQSEGSEITMTSGLQGNRSEEDDTSSIELHSDDDLPLPDGSSPTQHPLLFPTPSLQPGVLNHTSPFFNSGHALVSSGCGSVSRSLVRPTVQGAALRSSWFQEDPNPIQLPSHKHLMEGEKDDAVTTGRGTLPAPDVSDQGMLPVPASVGITVKEESAKIQQQPSQESTEEAKVDIKEMSPLATREDIVDERVVLKDQQLKAEPGESDGGGKVLLHTQLPVLEIIGSKRESTGQGNIVQSSTGQIKLSPQLKPRAQFANSPLVSSLDGQSSLTLVKSGSLSPKNLAKSQDFSKARDESTTLCLPREERALCAKIAVTSYKEQPPRNLEVGSVMRTVDRKMDVSNVGQGNGNMEQDKTIVEKGDGQEYKKVSSAVPPSLFLTERSLSVKDGSETTAVPPGLTSSSTLKSSSASYLPTATIAPHRPLSQSRSLTENLRAPSPSHPDILANLSADLDAAQRGTTAPGPDRTPRFV